jgi:hypothetical protein
MGADVTSSGTDIDDKDLQKQEDKGKIHPDPSPDFNNSIDDTKEELETHY